MSRLVINLYQLNQNITCVRIDTLKNQKGYGEQKETTNLWILIYYRSYIK